MRDYICISKLLIHLSDHCLCNQKYLHDRSLYYARWGKKCVVQQSTEIFWAFGIDVQIEGFKSPMGETFSVSKRQLFHNNTHLSVEDVNVSNVPK